jgi:acetylornithine deacetylase
MVVPNATAVARVLARRQSEVVTLLSELIAAPSEAGTSGEDAQRIVGRYLRLAGYAPQYTTDDPTLYVEHPEYTPPPPGEPPVNLVAMPPGSAITRLGLLAHIDTEPAHDSWTTLPTRPFTQEGHLYGLGAADDKSGVAAAAVAAAVLLEAGEPAPVVMSVHAKAGGARGTLPVFARAPELAAALYVHPSETGRGFSEIKHSTRGVLDFKLDVTGWQGPPHEIGIPESASFADGGDALQTALLVVGRLRGVLAGCDVNVGRIEAGERAGLVPAQCDLEIRVLFEEPMTAADLIAAIEIELARCVRELSSSSGHFRLRLAPVRFRANPATTPWDSDLSRAVRDAVVSITDLEPIAYAGHLASDLRFPIRMCKIPAVGIGCAAGGFYGPDEWVDVDDLVRLVAVVVAVSQAWNA